MADWWDTIFNPQGLRDYQRISPPEPKPLDRLVNPADDKAWWYGNRLYGEKLDPGALGIYGAPQPAGTPKYQPEGRDVVLPAQPPQRFLDRSRYVNRLPEARLTNELSNRHRAGQLSDREAYEILNSPEFSDENTLGAFHEMQSQGQGGSYLTRISASGGAAPPSGTFGEFEGEPIPNTGPSEYGLLQDYIRQQMMRPPTYKEGDIIPGGEHSNSNIDESMVIKPGPGRTGDENEFMDPSWHRQPDLQRISDVRGAAPPQQENYLSGPVTSARERLNPLEYFLMHRLENSRNVGYDARQSVPQDQLVDMIMRKYGLAESGRQHAEEYADTLRIFSNPEDYRNYEPDEGENQGRWRDRPTPRDDAYQPISDVRPSQDQYRRPPLASGIAPLPSARGFDPLIDLSGSDISTQGRRFERFDITRPGPYQLRGMYRKTFPF